MSNRVNHNERDEELEKDSREKFLKEQQGIYEPNRPNKCTCSKDGMVMTFHKEWCGVYAKRN